MNPQLLTPDVLNLVMRKAMVPLAMLLVIGGAIYYFNGELEADNVQLRFAIEATDWDIAETNERIATIDEELGVIREKGRRYDQILLTGFTRAQDRLAANQLIERLSHEHGIVTLTYGFEPETISLIQGRNDVDFELSQTEISLEITAHTDYAISGFVADFARSLEGQVQISAFTVLRKEEITDEMMRRIAEGAPSGSFFGALRLKWNNVSASHPDDEEADES